MTRPDTASTLAEFEWSPPGYANEDCLSCLVEGCGAHPGRPADLLDRIDDDLLAYDAQRSTGEPWPFESF